MGGAFAMGAGIWSMHFIGMLAFIMPMPISYSMFWTPSSLIAAILAASLAFYILGDKTKKLAHFILGGVFIGLGIATMHYMGMEGMIGHVNIHYLPSLFFLSIIIAIFASEAALWLALQTNVGSFTRQFYLKLIAAFVMGFAICGMHYTGMAAAVFTPKLGMLGHTDTIRPDLLAFFIAGVTALIISLALTVSTYYKRMVNAIQNEKEFLNAMLNNLEDGIIACNSESKITVLNDAIFKKTSLIKDTSTSNQSLNFFEFYSLDGKQLSKSDFPLYRALNGEKIHSEELLIKFKDGTIKDVIINGQFITNIQGVKLGAVITVHDITEVKETERLKSEFISVVSHELRTPLTSILGSLGLLISGTLGSFDSDVNKLLTIANNNCERLLLLINDILDVDKIQAGKMKFNLKPIAINSLVEEVVIDNKMYAKKFGVTLNFIELSKNLQVYVDPDRLLQVLTNLISNASKFSQEGQIVEIKISQVQDKIRVSVRDHGKGIPKEFQARIFQKFSQADSTDSRDKGGSGLGLNISKSIIEKFGGSLNFESEEGKGSTFYFDLPLYNESIVLNQKIFSMNDELQKVLICGNNDKQSKYINNLLSESGLNSDIVCSAIEARQLLTTHKYSAILLDLVLPDMDGISLIRQLRQTEHTKDLPIIVVSVVIRDGKEVLNGEAFSVADWLDQPINYQRLKNDILKLKKPVTQSLPRILHVEDDVDTRYVISSLIKSEAQIDVAVTLKEAIIKLGRGDYELVLLDLVLPDGNSSCLIPIIAKYQIPIIVYSAFDLDNQFSYYVAEALIKSKISNSELLETIKKFLKTPLKHSANIV